MKIKIMSLNVNKFSPFELLEGSKAKEIISCIQLFLFSDINNVVFLQEVPPKLVGELENALNGNTKLEEERFHRIISPRLSPSRRVFGYTIAIVNTNSTWEEIVEFKEAKRDFEKRKEFQDKQIYPWFFENKFVEIVNKQMNLRLLGVHAPWQSKEQRERSNNSVTIFFEALKDYATQKKDANQKFIIIGDLNADTIEESTYSDILKAIKKEAYSLPVEDLGENTVTYFSDATRIDHVLASPALSKVTAKVIPRAVLQLSDHAIIIADIDV